MKKMDKEERKAWVSRLLSSKGLPEYGRASRVTKDVECSHAMASSWLIGQMPKDMELAARFARTYETTVEEWVTGEKVEVPTTLHSEYEEAVFKAFEFQEEHGVLTPSTGLTVFNMMVKHLKGAFDVTTDSVILFEALNKQTREDQITNGGNGEC